MIVNLVLLLVFITVTLLLVRVERHADVSQCARGSDRGDGVVWSADSFTRETCADLHIPTRLPLDVGHLFDCIVSAPRDHRPRLADKSYVSPADRIVWSAHRGSAERLGDGGMYSHFAADCRGAAMAGTGDAAGQNVFWSVSRSQVAFVDAKLVA